MENGRKSFRAISQEIKVSTHTVKARFERLVNIGLIKSVKPEIGISKIDNNKKRQFFTEEKNQGPKQAKQEFQYKD
jgi:Lrp/AsnC family leucine-responsive transcriptional regulator